MATVKIKPMPVSWRKIPARLRPNHPPIFEGGEPTQEDVDLAIDLFELLDPESQEWYGGQTFLATHRRK